MKRGISILLLVAILTLASCGGQGQTEVTTGTNDPTGTTETETTAAGPVAGYLPDMDLSGFELRVATWRDDNGKYFWSEEANGDVVNDAVFDSINKVYDKYGAKIVPVFYGETFNDVRNYVTTTIPAGDDAFDLVHGHDGNMWNMSLEGYFMDVRDFVYQDFTQPWFPKNANDVYEVNGKQYIFTSYMSYQSLAWSKAVFMNKDIVDEFSLGLPYDDIRSGKWTLDKMLGMAKSVYTDLDGDSQNSEGDKFGFLAYKKLYGFQAAFVDCYTEDDGKISINYDKERFVDVVTKMNDLFTSENTFMTGNEPDPEIFIDGRALFYYGSLNTIETEEMRAMTTDFGVIPVPKYDEKQEDYITPAFDSQFAVPVTVSEPDKISLLIEAYSSSGYNIVRDAYFRTALQGKYTRDEDSVEMLNIISNTLKVDLAYLNTDAGIDGLGRAFMYCFSHPKTGIASYLDSIAASEQKKVDRINEFFAE